MADNKMLIDSAHPEETRVAMVRGNRVDEFDFESEHKTQLRGNIYLAKVIRVEPSLQAAFVDYGGNRHGFLAFNEIHPDYYQIPIADRQALLAEEEQEVRNAADRENAAADAASGDTDMEDETEVEVEAEESPKPRQRRSSRRKEAPAKKGASDNSTDEKAEESDDNDNEISAENDNNVVSEPTKKPRKRSSRAKKKDVETSDSRENGNAAANAVEEEKPRRRAASRKKAVTEETSEETDTGSETDDKEQESALKRSTTRRKKAPTAKKADEDETVKTEDDKDSSGKGDIDKDVKATADEDDKKKPRGNRSRRGRDRSSGDGDNDDGDENAASVEDVGSDDALEEVPTRRASRRHYKIQEVIKRRQILLVQVVKEERGNKGAALTTYLSLAGRYSVLMPNTARGGGISRKITNAADRKRLKSIASSFDVPQGMGVILRTAGASRKPEEIQRDFEYLMRLWESVRTLTLESTAPCLVYEEGSLIKRSIRDLYDNDTKEILVAGEAGHREAKDFMSMLMPEHAKKVKLYKDRIPLFAKMGVETQLDAMLQPQVTLKSGGYIIIDQTEALVAIDVNSGKSTRQHSIEETATQTNLEAADEIARQLRLRDFAGLIVIDFIDMDERRNNRSVEKRLKDALKHDRARIQVGRISHFGLLEMSRQRIRASVLESTTQVCPTCEGLGHVCSSSSVALGVLRAIEEQLNRSARNDLTVKVSTHTALYLLNNKRENLTDLEQRFGVNLTVEADNTIGNVPCVIEKGKLASRDTSADTAVQPDTIDPGDDTNSKASEADASMDEDDEEQPDAPRKKRRRRRRGKSSDQQEDDQQSPDKPEETRPTEQSDDSHDAEAEDGEKPKRSMRRKKEPNPVSNDQNNEAGAAETRRDAVTAKSEGVQRSETRRKKAPVGTAALALEVKQQAAQIQDSAKESVSSDAKERETDESDSHGKKKSGWWQRKFF